MPIAGPCEAYTFIKVSTSSRSYWPRKHNTFCITISYLLKFFSAGQLLIFTNNLFFLFFFFFLFFGIYTVLQLININLTGVLQLAWATHCRSVFVNVRNSNIYAFTELLWLHSVAVFFVKIVFFFCDNLYISFLKI